MKYEYEFNCAARASELSIDYTHNLNVYDVIVSTIAYNVWQHALQIIF